MVSGLHELDPVFRKVTLENSAIKAVAHDLKFHHDPVGTRVQVLSDCATFKSIVVALQSMVICKQTHIGGEGNCSIYFDLTSSLIKLLVPEHNDSYVYIHS